MDNTHEKSLEQKLKAKALRALARRDHGRMELKQKLSQISDDNALIEKILNECQTQNWLNELRFTQSYIRSRAQKHYGPKKIFYELQQRGIDKTLIENAFETEALDWPALAETARQRKFGKALAKTWAERGKQSQYLFQRGFQAGSMLQIDKNEDPA